MTTIVNWSASMISSRDDFGGAPRLRRTFTLDEGHGAIASAVLHVSSLGIFETYLNGSVVGDDVLSPGWTSYEWRIRYRTYDVVHLLKARSVLGIALGNGWFRGRLGWTGGRAFYGDRLAAVLQLEIVFADGHRQQVLSDGDWTASRSPTLANDLYDGQTIDARLREDDAWLDTGSPLSESVGVDIVDFDMRRLTPYVGPPVRRQEALQPTASWRAPSDALLVDFGQNLVGWLRIRVRGPRGSEIVVRHAEVLEHGELGVRPLRTAKATDRFILSGGDDFFEPSMTFHGFRYAEVSGWPADPGSASIEAVVVHSDVRRIGHFSCSDDLLNQFHRNVVWGLRGNIVDLPTDCPQRDERLGWTGDIAVFAPAAVFLFDMQNFLADWLLDLAAEQGAASGRVPFVVPDLIKFEAANQVLKPESTAIWGDASVWVPWAMWQASGDRSVLEAQYASMTAHVRRVASLTSPTGLWDRGFQFGDWLDPDAPPDQPWKAKANRGVVATACLYRSAAIMAEVASIVGRDDDAREFATLAARTRSAFNEHYVGADGSILSDASTVYALAIVFGLIDGESAQIAGDRLARLVVANGYCIATGFAGTPYVTDALTMTGHLDDAYRLLCERKCPSWLYPVTMGATTIWERWDSMLPDGTINPGQMTSFNHYALGAVVDWMHRTVGGIAPMKPGYAEVLIAPRPGGGITWASTSLDSPRGRIAVDWQCEGDELAVTVVLPDGVTGVLDMPGESPVLIGAGRTATAVKS